MRLNNKILIVIAGPTAVGKTKLAIELATLYGTEIISADSRQFYTELNIGTAKPSEEELIMVPHHFINNLSIHESYNVGKYEVEVLAVLDSLFKIHDKVIMVGGSGLFIKAVCEGMDEIDDVDLDIRNSLNNRLETEGLNVLCEDLKKYDPVYYEKVDLKNPQRVIRALEVCIATGKPFSSFRNNEKAVRSFSIVKLGLQKERQALYEGINARVDRMMNQGLLQEVSGLVPFKEYNTLQTVGYSELFNYLEEKLSINDAVELIKRNTRRYAKRQMTWFNKDNEMKWFNSDDYEGVVEYIKNQST